jgi:phage tail-like protein
MTSASKSARVFDSLGTERETAQSVAALRGRFAPMPFRVDANGALDFSCSPGPCCCAFGPDGAVIPGGAKPDTPLFATDGFYGSKALDSGIADCQWHRVILCGEIPSGTTVSVLTWSSEVSEPDELVAALPDDAWETRQVARRAPDVGERCTTWDCLVRSGPGRYLWLKLRLRGDGRSSPSIDRVDLELPRISLARYLPGVYGEDPAAGEFTDRFLSIFDTTVRSIERQLDHQAALFDPRSTPATPEDEGHAGFPVVARVVGGHPARQALARRAPPLFLRDAPGLFDRRGTLAGLRSVLLLYLGLGDDTPPRARGRRRRGPGRWTPARVADSEPV